MQGRLQTLPLCESSRDDVIDSITRFLSPRNYSKVSLFTTFSAALVGSLLLLNVVAAILHCLTGFNLSHHLHEVVGTSQVLIVSYETFRTHADRFRSDSACDLLICDEAHRLKNDQ